MKKCNICFALRPMTDYNYSSQKKDLRQNICKDCFKVYYSEWADKRKAAPQTEFPQSKTCQECGIERPISQFGKRSTAKDKKMSICKDCWRIVTRNALARHHQRKVKANG